MGPRVGHSAAGEPDSGVEPAGSPRKCNYARGEPWEALIGDPDKDREAIDAVSPALHADKFKAPVLLIHGAADTVVPIRQSEIMNDALKAAQKSVQYTRINGDDHSLVDNDSRRTALSALGEFLNKHIGK
jgi:dipeptidyl aminopeptidase/acylaminoacyl peptidase